MTHSMVAYDATPGNLSEQEHDVDVDAFLVGHLNAMRALALKNDSPLAYFSDSDCEKLFDDLNNGSESSFYGSATELTQRLVGKMDGRTRPGLLICLRAFEGKSSWAAVLKLEVVTADAAVLRSIESGEMALAAAKDVLNAPGKLQKGAVVADPRSGSSVIVGDKLTTQSAYFPAGLGITTQQRPRDAAVDVVEVLDSMDSAVAREVIRALPDVVAGPVEDVLLQLGERVPTLTVAMQEDAIGALRNRRRPVETVDTSVALKANIKASGITITLPASMVDDVVSIEPRPEGGWQITIRVDEEPQVSTKK